MSVPLAAHAGTHVVAQAVTTAEIEDRIRATKADHAETLRRFHDVWYHCGHSWIFTHILGVPVMKLPTDLWAYHELLVWHRPETIIETGTAMGGSALWFALLMDALGIDGQILTIDQRVDEAMARHRKSHPKITYLEGSSTDPALVARVQAQVRGRVLISLDSEHTAQHVFDELQLWAPLCRVGDWLVVEDTNVGWAPTDHQTPDELASTGDPGANAGLQIYLAHHPGEWESSLLSERWLMTCNPGGYLHRVKEAP